MEISSELFFLFSGLYLLLLAAFYFLGKSRGMTDVYVRQERMASEEHARKTIADKIVRKVDMEIDAIRREGNNR